MGGASGRPEGRAAAARGSRHEKHGREKKRQEYKFPLKTLKGGPRSEAARKLTARKLTAKFFADQLSGVEPPFPTESDSYRLTPACDLQQLATLR